MEYTSNAPAVYTIRNRESGEFEYYISFLPHDFAFEKGLPSEAVLGKLSGGPDRIDPEHFRPNAKFLDFLHSVIARHASGCPGLIAEAQRQKEGAVFIIDARTQTPNGDVPPEDIIGAVEVHNGSVSSYQGNPNYLLFTSSGWLMLDPWFRGKLLDEIADIIEEST